MPRLTADRHAVSVPMNYVLMTGIVTLLAVTLLTGTGAYVEDQQERGIRAGLDVVGNRIASDVSTADRLAGTLDGDGTVAVRTDLPVSVAGTTYQIELRQVGTDTYEIILTSTDPAVTVTVPVRSSRAITTGTVTGGPLDITYDDTNNELEVNDA